MGNISKIRIQNTDYAIKDSRVDSKVDKVSSTDNAIVRFDGTSGNIQNSGVTINDSNHLTAAKLITSGGTSSQFVKGDGSLDSNYYFRPGDRILTNDGFASKKELYITKLDNILYSAHIRYVVTHKLYDNNGNFIEDLNTNLFDCNYEKASQKVKDGYYAELYIGVVEETELANTSKILATYCSGELLLTFYNNMICSGMTAKLYTSRELGNTPSGWYNLSPTVDTGLSINNNNNIYKINVSPSTYVAAFKIRYDGKTTGNYGASLTQVEWYGTRVGVSQQSVVTKYPIAQDLWGEVTAPKFITRNGASSQFVKGNGTLDSTSYAPLASPALTGTPTAPTAASGTNTTQIATTAFVQSTIADKADSATTLAGYGITDAKIEDKSIILGENSITPIEYIKSATAQFPVILPDSEKGLMYYDTTLNKWTYFEKRGSEKIFHSIFGNYTSSPTTEIGTFVSKDTDTSYDISAYKNFFENPCEEGKTYSFTKPVQSCVFYFTNYCKGTTQDIPATEKQIQIAGVTGGTATYTFIAPDPEEYPYIEMAKTGDGTANFRIYEKPITWSAFATEEYVDDKLGDIETLLASI